MLKKFLVEVIVSIVGKTGENLIDLLDSKKYINEFLIAKKLGLTINQTRNILYKISNRGLVSSIRKKDKKKGWYTYFWKIEVLKSLEFLKEILLKNIAQIDSQIKSRTEKQFYICKRCNIEITEEKALQHDFICNECGEIYSLKDNILVIKGLKKEKERFEKQLKSVNEEIQKEKEKLEKAKMRKSKKEEKEKAQKRKAKREATKKKSAKKATKKKIKKRKIKSSKKGIKSKTQKIKKKKISKKKIKPKIKKTKKKSLKSKKKK